MRGPRAAFPFSLTKSERVGDDLSHDGLEFCARYGGRELCKGIMQGASPGNAAEEIRNCFLCCPTGFNGMPDREITLIRNTARISTPSRRSSVAVDRMVNAASFGLIFSCNARSNSGSLSEAASWQRIIQVNAVVLAEPVCFCVSSSGMVTAFHRASSITTGRTSVSGYIRAAPGSGRIYAVLPSLEHLPCLFRYRVFPRVRHEPGRSPG